MQVAGNNQVRVAALIPVYEVITKLLARFDHWSVIHSSQDEGAAQAANDAAHRGAHGAVFAPSPKNTAIRWLAQNPVQRVAPAVASASAVSAQAVNGHAQPLQASAQMHQASPARPGTVPQRVLQPSPGKVREVADAAASVASAASAALAGLSMNGNAARAAVVQPRLSDSPPDSPRAFQRWFDAQMQRQAAHATPSSITSQATSHNGAHSDAAPSKGAATTAAKSGARQAAHANQDCDCRMCFEFLLASPIACPPCGHVFHLQCLQQMLAAKQQCPIYQKACKPKQLMKLYF